MHIETLVKMANDIGSFFQAEPDHAEAVRGVFEHLRKFWDPRMRKQIVAHYHAGGLGLSSLVREAVRKLADEMESIVQSGDGWWLRLHSLQDSLPFRSPQTSVAPGTRSQASGSHGPLDVPDRGSGDLLINAPVLGWLPGDSPINHPPVGAIIACRRSEPLSGVPTLAGKP